MEIDDEIFFVILRFIILNALDAVATADDVIAANNAAGVVNDVVVGFFVIYSMIIQLPMFAELFVSYAQCANV